MTFAPEGTPSNQFNIFSWSSSIPFCDEIWFGMQVRNIALVDLTFIRPMEQEALETYIAHEKTPIDVLLPLSAISQMWIFSLYEFLRTWRQRASELIRLSDEYKALSEKERPPYLANAAERLKSKRKLVRVGPEMHASHLEKFTDEQFVNRVAAYKKETDWLFREVESLRVTLAKHEVPKTSGLLAEGPGYGRMDIGTGSMYWFITLKDDSQIKVDRRELGNAFLGIDDIPI